MSSLIRKSFICACALVLICACARAEHPNSAELSAPTAISLDEPLPPELQGDGALAAARSADRNGRSADGQLPQMTPAEHLRRAAIYQANRAFDEAREHWNALITRYPNDVNVPVATFGIGRTFFQERRYADALPVFEGLGNAYAHTEAGRDGFYYVGATLLRLGRAGEAAARYIEYTERFPQGERIENAYLNVIDGLREAGRPAEAIPWIARTRERFVGTPTEVNALFARLRLDVSGSDWQSAVRTADELSRMNFGRGVMTSRDEVAYLRAYSLERAGQTAQAIQGYQTIPDRLDSFHGGLATTRLQALGGAARNIGNARAARVRAEALRAVAQYPAPYREIILRHTTSSRVDPRFVLAIMRQESRFNPRAKSNAGARGLLQLIMDAAQRYAPRAGINNLQEDDLYRPEVNIQIAVEYMKELFGMFPNSAEAVAASYNGGEDNVARWVRRAAQTDAGVIASEVGFDETKGYVAKVIANFRAYQILYSADLRRR